MPHGHSYNPDKKTVQMCSRYGSPVVINDVIAAIFASFRNDGAPREENNSRQVLTMWVLTTNTL